jgi:hypothetical protein
LDGEYLLNPASAQPWSQPRFEKDLEGFRDNLTLRGQ